MCGLQKNFERIGLKKTLLASVVGAMFLPHTTLGQTTTTGGSNLDLAQAPPGTTQSYVAPNVILSLDDSGSMRGNNMNTLKAALIDVFEDKTLLPDGKIRLAWQSMFNCTMPKGLKIDFLDASVASNPNGLDNAMKRLSGTHRTNFLQYTRSMVDCGWTPTHHMSRRAHQYMTAPIHVNGPWADHPGEELVDDPSGQRTKPLGCRRNYHILLTDGEWNEVYWDDISIGNADGRAKTLPDGIPYDPNSRDGRLYGDNDKGLISRGAPYGTPAETTVSDWAFHSWSESLQNPQDLDGTLSMAEYDASRDSVEIKNKSSGETFIFKKYWNPENNPASWPHMVTYTIGFGAAAIPRWSHESSGRQRGMDLPSEDLPFGTDGNLAEYANGTRIWRAWSHPQLDMWHAALNGRGKFYAVRKNEDLKTAFRSIIQDINTKVEPVKGSSVASGSNVSRTDVAIYTASFDAKEGWKGTIEAKTLGVGGGSGTTLWGGKGTADKLDAISDVNTRVILSSKMNGPNDRLGIPFRWNTLGGIEKSTIGSSNINPVAHSGSHIVDYLRGDITKQGSSDARPFRKRTSLHGDIVNSNIWHVAAPSNIDHFTQEGYVDFVNKYRHREPMLYVGANDGMLHGFSAKDNGAERIAYVPHGVLQNLKKLTEPAFDSKHHYFVDGSPMTGDIKDGNDWKTILVGSLGAGGKGYFVLDVTDPQSFSEANAAKLVVKDMTLPSDSSLNASEQLGKGYLGHIFATPALKHGDSKNTVQIARLNNDRWAVVMGNGYGSTQGEAALLIQFLDKGKELLVIPASQGPIDGKQRHNGLSAPRLVDINGDGRPDVVYAGDLTGNLWKFLINTEDEKKWGVAQWSNGTGGGSPLFSANLGEKHSANVENSTRQAIFAAPAVAANERTKNVGSIEVAVNGMMVAFGTGRNITVNDPIEKQQQTLYSILDNTVYMFERDASNIPTGRVLVCDAVVAAPAPCSNLVKTQDDLPSAVKQSELLERRFAKTVALQRNGADFWTLDQTPVADLDFATHKGWYIQLPEDYERSLKNLDFYDNTTVLMAVTQVPAKGGDHTSDGNVESCDAGGIVAGERQYVNFIDIQDGNPPHFKLIDGSTDVMPLLRAEISPGSLLPIVISETKISFQVEASQSGLGLGARPATQVVRPNWRQLN